MQFGICEGVALLGFAADRWGVCTAQREPVTATARTGKAEKRVKFAEIWFCEKKKR